MFWAEKKKPQKNRKTQNETRRVENWHQHWPIIKVSYSTRGLSVKLSKYFQLQTPSLSSLGIMISLVISRLRKPRGIHLKSL